MHPERLAGPLAEFRVRPEQLTAEQLLPFVPRAAEIDQYKDKRLFAVAKILAETATVHGAATALMQLEPWDFMAVYFDAIDHFGHGFMKYHPPRQAWIGEADYALYKDVVAGGYRFHDMMLGTSMELAGPDTNILICSDHGFHPDHLRPREIPNEPAGPAAEHRHQDAERVFQEILGIDPVNAQAQSGLAQSYLGRRGLEEPALAALGASLALVFHNPRGHYLRGAVLMRLKRFDEAIAAFETAVAQNSVYPAAHRRLAQLLPRIGAGLKYRIVFLERPLNEVIASQRAMLARTGKEGGRLTDRRLAQAYLKQLASVRAVLKRYPERVALLSVNYHEALAAPAGTAARVHAFLGGGLDESAMAAAIDPTLRRQGSATSEAA